MDETARQSWGVVDMQVQQSSFPERTVLMETYEAGCFSYSSNMVQLEVMDEIPVEPLNFIDDTVGQPVECSTPTKTQL